MKANLPRRKFLSAVSSLAVASATSKALGISATASDPSPRPKVVVFSAPAFPAIDGCVTDQILQPALEGFDVTYASATDLAARLNAPGIDLLITPYGSAFPRMAWASLLTYLQ